MKFCGELYSNRSEFNLFFLLYDEIERTLGDSNYEGLICRRFDVDARISAPLAKVWS